jgi:hypothetical protein
MIFDLTIVYDVPKRFEMKLFVVLYLRPPGKTEKTHEKSEGNWHPDGDSNSILPVQKWLTYQFYKDDIVINL